MEIRSYDSIKVGEKASFTKTVTETDIIHPVHINKEFAKNSMFKERIAHGILTAGFISAVAGTQLPGPNSIYLKQVLNFTAPVKIGDTITATVEVSSKRDDKHLITLDTTCTNQRGEKVITGEALVKKPD